MEIRCLVHGIAFSVQIARNAKVEELKRAILSDRFEDEDASALTLYLTKDKTGAWLREDENMNRLASSRIDSIYQLMPSYSRINSALFFGPDFGPGESEIHVAGQLSPRRAALNTEAVLAGGCAFAWLPPKPLVAAGVGSDWDFQNPVDLRRLAYEIKAYHSERTEGDAYRYKHPMFFCIAGPGTGKSRLLDEFPNLIQRQIFQGDEDEEMMRLLRNAFTFKIRFDGDTPIEGDSFVMPSMTIGTRMLYQLQDSMKWGPFRAIAAHQVSPEQALTKLAHISGIPSYEMCVILCVDGLEKLGKLDSVLRSLRDLVNKSECWCIVLSSSRTFQPVLWGMAGSHQNQIHLDPATLSRPTIHGRDAFEEFENGSLLQLLIDDMGGFGRAIEVLYTVMVEMRKAAASLEFVPVLCRVVDVIRETFPAIRDTIEDMREAFMAVVSRQSINCFLKSTSFGNSTVDGIISSGLMRLRKLDYRDYLECPYVLYLLLDSEAHPWDELCKYAPRELREDFKPCRLWGELNCKVRVLKSMALFTDDSDLENLIAKVQLSEEEFREEQTKLTGEDDFFMLYCTGDVLFDVYNLTKCAVIDRSGWTEYYGPFAARALFAATAPPSSAQTFSLVVRTVKKRTMFQREEAQEEIEKSWPTSKRHQSTSA